jgi:hypothetical protein
MIERVLSYGFMTIFIFTTVSILLGAVGIVHIPETQLNILLRAFLVELAVVAVWLLIGGKPPYKPEITYEYARGKIKNGDILMYDSNSWQHDITRRLPGLKFKFSHIGVATWWNERLFVLESVTRKGARAQLLSTSIRDYHGRVALHVPRTPLEEHERKAIIKNMQDQFGKDFAKWEALLLGIKLWLNIPLSERDKASPAKRVFCSSYVAYGYNAAGIDLIPQLADQHVKPDAIANATQFDAWIKEPPEERLAKPPRTAPLEPHSQSVLVAANREL